MYDDETPGLPRGYDLSDVFDDDDLREMGFSSDSLDSDDYPDIDDL